ncbi:MAG TPA: Imm42 family immunity protein [Thiolinea sp.]|nr:Imm42 family immunity protein [Thiolinea sp.]
MLIGDKQSFAIEFEILDIVDGWVFGTFIFWVVGLVIGNPEDKSVDLKGCMNWLRDFVATPKNRFERGLYDLDKEQIYIQLCSSVLVGEENSFAEEKYSDTYSRFHTSHIGMSSFDDVTMIMVENGQGDVRCVWKQDDQEILEAFLKMSEVNKVAANTVTSFEDLIRAV